MGNVQVGTTRPVGSAGSILLILSFAKVLITAFFSPLKTDVLLKAAGQPARMQFSWRLLADTENVGMKSRKNFQVGQTINVPNGTRML